jgi:hypothetical protein
VGTAAATGQPAEATLGVVDIIFLLLPWVGSLLLLGMMAHQLARWVRVRFRRLPVGRVSCEGSQTVLRRAGPCG